MAGALTLPTLIQRIAVDTSQLRRANRTVHGFFGSLLGASRRGGTSAGGAAAAGFTGAMAAGIRSGAAGVLAASTAVSVAAATAMVGGLAAAVSYEQAFADVRKTVDATEAEFAKLNQQIRDMAKDIPATREEIAGVASAAGQLGIKTDAIAGFTRVMVDMGVATNMTANEAAMTLARLANITKMPQNQFDRLASTVVHLGNNMAATEDEIARMGLRIAGAGNQVNLTEAEILSMAAALTSVGVNIEAGGTAISRVMLQMNDAVMSGGVMLERYAAVAGMSASDFKRAFQEDAASAIASFIEGIERIRKEGGNVNQTLRDLQLGEIRVRNALLVASGAGDLFRRSLELGNTAWRENTALTTEAERKYATTANRLKVLWNRITDVGVTIGNALLPVFNRLLDVLIRNVDPAFNAITDAFDRFIGFARRVHSTVREVVDIFGILGGPGGPMGFAIHMDRLVGGGGRYVDFFRGIGSAVLQIRDFISEMIPRVVSVARVIGGAFLGAVMGVVNAGLWMARNWDTVWPIMRNVGIIIGTLLVPHFVRLGVQALITRARVAAFNVALGVQSVRSAGMAVVSSYRIIGSWIAMSAQALWAAGRMAAAWVIGLGPIGWAIAAVTAIAALIIANWDKISEWTRKTWESVSGWVTGAVRGVMDWLGRSWPTILAILAGPFGIAARVIAHNWETIKQAVSTAFNAVVGVITSAMSAVWRAIEGPVNVIIDIWQVSWWWAQQVWGAVWDSIYGKLRTAWAAITGILRIGVAFVSAVWNAVWTKVSDFFVGIWQRIARGFQERLAQVQAVLRIALTFISALWNTVWSAVSGFFVGIWQRIARGFQERLAQVQAVLRIALTFISALWNTVWTAVSTKVSAIWIGIKNAVGGAIDWVRDRISSRINEVRSFWSTVWDAVSDKISTIMETIRSRVSTFADSVRSMFNTLKNRITSIWDAVREAVAKPIRWVIDTVWNKGIVKFWNVAAGVLPGVDPLKEITLNFQRGGLVPGSGRGDKVPAMLEPGEVVLSRPAVEALGGARAAVAFNEAARRRQQDRALRDDNNAMGGVGGYSVGRGAPLPARLLGQETISAMRAWGQVVPGARISSAYRTGSSTYHGKGQATDWVGPLDKIWSRFAQVGSRLRELIYTGAPYWILGGRKRAPYRGRLWDTHKDHVHVATLMKDLGAGQAIGDVAVGGGGLRGWIAERAAGLLDPIKRRLRDFATEHKGIGAMLAGAANSVIDKTLAFISGGAGAFTAGGGVAAGNLASIAAQFGWGSGAQYDALLELLRRESGGNPRAQNPKSTAYGRWQFLDSTWATVGGRKTSDPDLQDLYGMRYIQARYGNPINALQFHNRHNWYDGGGLLKKGVTLAMHGSRHPDIVAARGMIADELTSVLESTETLVGGQRVRGGRSVACDLQTAINRLVDAVESGELGKRQYNVTAYGYLPDELERQMIRAERHDKARKRVFTG